MSHQRLQHILTTGHYALPVAIILALICWGIPFVTPAGQTSWISSVIGFLSYAVIGYLLILLNNSFALIRIRASVQTIVYLMLVAACPMIHHLSAEDVATAFYLLALFMLLFSYQQSTVSTQMFYSFLFLGTGSLLYPQLTYFVPLFWIGGYMFQSLSSRSFFAGCLGWLLPYWFLLAYAYLADDMRLFVDLFGELTTFRFIFERGFQPWEAATLLYLFILFAVSSVHDLTNGFQEKMRTRVYMQFFSLLTLFFFLFVVLQPEQTSQMLPFLLINVSLLGGHFLALSDSRSSNWFVIFMLMGLLLLFAFNVWMLL
ncbi:MAG: hypothetical protein LBN06_04500 [Prevotellaceae bacterium]|jgi:hypothetical protein|nr:hypothetical protein [Prevotellaceae bacterium]